MKPAVLLAVLLGAITPVFGSHPLVKITSPDRTRTFAYGEMVWRQLSLDPVNGVLTARITFSNLPHVSDTEPRRDESFNFRFPGLLSDQDNHALVARARDGHKIVVAKYRSDWPWRSVDLASGAKIYLIKESGVVTAILTATDGRRAGPRWIQMDDNLSLQNLLINCFGRLADSRR